MSLCSVALVTLTGPLAVSAKADVAAESVAYEWLGLVDANSYKESWNEASTLFRERMSQSRWKSTVLRSRHYLGPLRNRRFLSAAYESNIRGSPDGQYEIVKFLSNFAQFQSVYETVVAKKGADGTWRVADYYIASDASSSSCTGTRLGCD
jgi:Protein of unknown function (DUF4019)